MANLQRPRSPRSIVDHPTMAVPRRWWTIQLDGRNTKVIDLYGTLNMYYGMYQQYKIAHNIWETIQAFLEDLRFSIEPRLSRWPNVPHPTLPGVDPYMAEDWLGLFGVAETLIDLSSDEEEDMDGGIPDDVFADISDEPAEGSQMFDDENSVVAVMRQFMEDMDEEERMRATKKDYIIAPIEIELSHA